MKHLLLPVLMGKRSYANKLKSLFGSSLIAYWPLKETSGATIVDVSGNSRNGAYTGVDLANAAGPKGGMAPYFDAANDYGNIYSVSLRDAFNGAEGSILGWFKVYDAATWADATARRFFTLTVDANNWVTAGKASTANNFTFQYKAATVTSQVIAALGPSVLWIHITLTWSKSTGATGEVKAYVNGSQSGATQINLGVWAGQLAAATTVLGASTLAPAAVWHGWLNHALILNRAATPTEIANVYSWT